MKRHGNFKDSIIGWTAHAKLTRAIADKLAVLKKFVKTDAKHYESLKAKIYSQQTVKKDLL